MKIITISREFGSGGRELGKRLADILGFDYYDKEIIAAIARKKEMDEGYIEEILDNNGWQNIPLTFHCSFVGMKALNSAQTSLLLEQKNVIEEIARNGKDCVIVGRNADVILKEYKPFSIFVCADMEVKLQRCIERAGKDEKMSDKEMKKNMRKIDKNRAETRQLICSGNWGERSDYHLTVNTTDWTIKELTPAVAAFLQKWFERENR